MARKQVALAKISRPGLHDVLARTRLYGALDKACKRPVVWLSAEPGAGKTALVAGHLQARKRPGIWYQVDAGDSDPASFIYHLRLAAQTAGALDTADLPVYATRIGCGFERNSITQRDGERRGARAIVGSRSTHGRAGHASVAPPGRPRHCRQVEYRRCDQSTRR